ncbi:MAG TPA: DedA family protein [Candidatus Saccharimonadales bacterium]|nr:DedA family protein [Candidatus Saccharimonadales bacterium]
MHSALGQFAVNLIDQFGYMGVAASLMLNAMGVPLPSEVILPVGGVAIKSGTFSWAAFFIVAILAQLVGASLSWLVGDKGGAPLVHRIGRYILLSQHDIDITNKWFKDRGRGWITLGYCLPVLRGYVGWVTGIAEVPFRIFAPAALLGIVIWTAALTILGYQLADQLDTIEQVMKPFSLLIALCVAVLVIFFIWKRLRERVK